VPDRKAPTLLAAIQENIAEGSIIYSDSWKGYQTTELEKAGFEHFKVNHQWVFCLYIND
jgi:transposase-like protein